MTNRNGILKIARQQTLTCLAIMTIFGGGLIPVSNAIAEGENQAVSQKMEDVVVTARFRRETQQTIPLAVTAISATMLESKSQISLLDVAKATPSITIQPASAGFGGGAAVSIRGVGQYDTNLGLEPGVGIYIDDVYYPMIFGSVFDLLDIDRVEILRGPQGTLAGKNSIGGAVKLYSKLPNSEDTGSFSIGAGSFNTINARASGNFTIVPNVVDARISAVSKESKGYLTRYDYNCRNKIATAQPAATSTDCKLGTEGGIDFKGIRGALRTRPRDDLDINLIVDRTQDKSEPAATRLIDVVPGSGASLTGTAQYIPSSGDKFASYATYSDPAHGLVVPASSNITNDGVSASFNYKLNSNMTLTLISAYRKIHGEFGIDGDGSPLSTYTSFNTFDNKYSTEELRLNGSLLADRLDYTAGLYYFDSKGAQGGRVDIGPSTTPFNLDFLQDDRINVRSKAAFLNATYHVTNELNVSAGTRYTDDMKTYTFGRYSLDGVTPYPLAPFPGAPSLNGVGGTFKGDRWDYRLSADYTFMPGLLIYSSYSTGEKGGGINPRPFDLTQVLPFNPEIVKAYEAGVKFDTSDRKLRVNVAAFLNQYQDIIVNRSTPPPAAIPTNAGSADVTGLEIEFTARPIQGLSIDGSFSTLDFKYKKLSPAALNAGITSSMVNPFAPKTKVALGVQYEFSLGGNGTTLTPRLDVNHQSYFYTNALNADSNKVDGRTLVDARLTWRSADSLWEIALAATNLLNKYYYSNNFDVGTNGPIVAGGPSTPSLFRGTVEAVVGTPREYLLTLKRNF